LADEAVNASNEVRCSGCKIEELKS
jgi:hypothetical protein